MTHAEVYAELAKERDAVTRWWRHQLYDQRRRALKCRQFPYHIWREYISTRKNRYLFFSRIFDKKMRKILTGVAVVRHTSEGLTVYTTWLGDQKLISPMVLLPHVWKRYQDPKRGNVQKSGIELIKHYFLHNPHGADSHNQKVVGRSVRWNGEVHQSCCVNDGVLLGQIVDGIYIARTFITYDMCGEIQKESFEKSRSKIVTGKDYYKIAKPTYFDL